MLIRGILVLMLLRVIGCVPSCGVLHIHMNANESIAINDA